MKLFVEEDLLVLLIQSPKPIVGLLTVCHLICSLVVKPLAI